MKICIVTVHDSINCGSYWQAYALGHVLKEMGHEVRYLKRASYNDNRRQRKKNLKMLAGTFIYQSFGAGMRYLRRLRGFRAAQKKMSEMDFCPDAIRDTDCFILGSDTIWNFNDIHFRRNQDIFLGKPFLEKTVIPYAASAGNTQREQFEKIEGLTEVINGWKAVGVRDNFTRDIIAAFTDREISMVCDPTLLMNKADYMQIAPPAPEQKYILLYLFDKLSSELLRELEAFAQEKKLKLVKGTPGDLNIKCDRMDIGTPDSFLACFAHADYIITDTFHGTVFSANLEKRFVAVNRNKNKVNGFLEQMQLSDRLLSEGDSLRSALEREIDYAAVRSSIDACRAHSLSFLKDAINE